MQLNVPNIVNYCNRFGHSTDPAFTRKKNELLVAYDRYLEWENQIRDSQTLPSSSNKIRGLPTSHPLGVGGERLIQYLFRTSDQVSDEVTSDRSVPIDSISVWRALLTPEEIKFFQELLKRIQVFNNAFIEFDSFVTHNPTTCVRVPLHETQAHEPPDPKLAAGWAAIIRQMNSQLSNMVDRVTMITTATYSDLMLSIQEGESEVKDLTALSQKCEKEVQALEDRVTETRSRIDVMSKEIGQWTDERQERMRKLIEEEKKLKEEIEQMYRLLESVKQSSGESTADQTSEEIDPSGAEVNQGTNAGPNLREIVLQHSMTQTPGQTSDEINQMDDNLKYTLNVLHEMTEKIKQEKLEQEKLEQEKLEEQARNQPSQSRQNNWWHNFVTSCRDLLRLNEPSQSVAIPKVLTRKSVVDLTPTLNAEPIPQLSDSTDEQNGMKGAGTLEGSSGYTVPILGQEERPSQVLEMGSQE